MNDSTLNGREITSKKLLLAPRELVFRMWTDPTHIARWWGPNGFSITIHEIDVRPGGHWRFIMHGPDGTDYPNEIVYREVTEPSRIVYTHVSDPLFDMTVIFEEERAGTRITATLVFASQLSRDDAAQKYGAIEGLAQTLDRLSVHVTNQLSAN